MGALYHEAEALLTDSKIGENRGVTWRPKCFTREQQRQRRGVSISTTDSEYNSAFLPPRVVRGTAPSAARTVGRDALYTQKHFSPILSAAITLSLYLIHNFR